MAPLSTCLSTVVAFYLEVSGDCFGFKKFLLRLAQSWDVSLSGSSDPEWGLQSGETVSLRSEVDPGEGEAPFASSAPVLPAVD